MWPFFDLVLYNVWRILIPLIFSLIVNKILSSKFLPFFMLIIIVIVIYDQSAMKAFKISFRLSWSTIINRTLNIFLISSTHLPCGLPALFYILFGTILAHNSSILQAICNFNLFTLSATLLYLSPMYSASLF